MAHFLLIHGACHGGWCWDSVVPLLRDAGHAVTAPDLPCDSADAGLADYADHALAALGRAPEDLVVVAHSLGGLVAPIIASRLPTRRLVFLAGIVGMPGMSLADLGDVDTDRDLPLGDDGLVFNDQGMFCFSDAGARRVLYPDCDEESTAAAISKLRFQRSMWTQVAEFDAWPDTEIVSITCTDDLVVNPVWSDAMARNRFGIEPVHLDGGHSPFLSRPAELVGLLTAGL